MKVQRIIRLVVFVSLTCNVLFINHGSVFAQTDTGNIVTFTTLGQKEIGLQGPLDVQSFSFHVPADWEFLAGGQLHLDFSTFFNGNNSSSNSGVLPVAGYLEIALNGTPLATLALNQVGDNSIDIPLYTDVWHVTDPTVSSRLEFTVRTPGPCNTAFMNSSGPLGGLNVVIHPSSYLDLPHKIAPLAVDLRLLPYPIFQNSFMSDTAVLVIPNNPTEKELQAAFITSAVLGRLSQGLLQLSTVTIGVLDQAHLTDSHLIFVGEPSSFPILSQATWPVQIAGGNFSNLQMGQNDGVIQMALSPQSPAKVWLMVSGMNDDGVVKAAQALESGKNIRVSDNPALSIVTDVQEQQVNDLGKADTTFADLGYGNQDSWGPGIRYTEYLFNIPSDQQVGDGAYLDLVFTHSAMLDFDGAGISISLNGDYIGSFRFTEQTAQVSSWRLNFPKSSFVGGENRLLISANLVPISSCLPTNQLWFSSRSESVLHLPLEAAAVESPQLLLRKYPAPFSPTLDNTAFVVPSNNANSWFDASRISFDLGWKTTGTVINPAVAFADSVPDAIRNGRDILLIGQPSLMSGFIKELVGNMPAPFENGSDIAKEPSRNFMFAVPSDIPVGYLQIFSSPWNANKLVLAVTGNGVDGLDLAVDALTIPTQFSQLGGNVAVIYNGQIIAAQTKSPDQITVLGTPAAVATQTAQVVQQNPGTQQSGLTLSPVMVGIVLVVVFALIVIGILVLRREEK